MVKDDAGFRVWGSVPSALALLEVEVADEIDPSYKWKEQRGMKNGDRITFTATVTPSNDSRTFGFFKRPGKASVLKLAE